MARRPPAAGVAKPDVVVVAVPADQLPAFWPADDLAERERRMLAESERRRGKADDARGLWLIGGPLARYHERRGGRADTAASDARRAAGHATGYAAAL
ncbi:hypothetical protein [Dactylosporangium sp. CA-139066]|uniref:hypothetical protein n=1 Tax=Dactylosporangium sp. CA-139066 TaxID=3239930 RepID=UPI003D8FF20E